MELGESIPGPQRAPARAPTRTRERTAPERPKATYLANVVRAADEHAAEAMTQLTEALGAAFSVDIERTHPLWCKGWLEEYQLSAPDVRELRQHIQSEYGGQSYRLSVLDPSGKSLYVAKMEIAGPPRDRGRTITRDSWDPVDNAPRVAPAASVPANNGTSFHMELVTLMRDSMRDQTNAMKDMITSSRAETKDLIQSIVQVRAAESQGGSFAGQLSEFVNTAEAVEKVRRRLTPKAQPAAPAAVPADDGGMDPILREAGKAFAQNVVGSMFQPKGGQPPAQQQPRPDPAPQRRQAPPPPPPPAQAAGFRRKAPAASRAPVEAESIPGFSAPAGQA